MTTYRKEHLRILVALYQAGTQLLAQQATILLEQDRASLLPSLLDSLQRTGLPPFSPTQLHRLFVPQTLYHLFDLLLFGTTKEVFLFRGFRLVRFPESLEVVQLIEKLPILSEEEEYLYATTLSQMPAEHNDVTPAREPRRYCRSRRYTSRVGVQFTRAMREPNLPA